MPNILPPPSTGVPVVQDRGSPSKTMDFTSVWRQWFIDLVEILNRSGGTDGAIPSSRRVNTTAPIEGGGDLSADRTLSVLEFNSSRAGVVPASGGGTTNFLRADRSWAPTTSGFSGTVPLAKLTAGGANGSLTFVNGVLTNRVAPT